MDKLAPLLLLCFAVVASGCVGDSVQTPENNSNSSIDNSPDPFSQETSSSDSNGEPSFELVSLTSDETVQSGGQVTVEAEVRNTGDAIGNFSQDLMVSFAENNFETTRDSGANMEAEIEAGDTETISLSNLNVNLATYRFSLPDYNKTADTEVITRNISYGESYTNHRNMSITVEDVEVNRSYQVDGRTETPDGGLFAFVEFKAKNVGTEPDEPESGQELWLITEEDRPQLNSFDYTGGETYPMFEESELAPGETRTGYAIFELDYGVGKEDIEAVQWLGEEDYIETETYWKN